jgi:hypothetical protein
MRWTAAISSAGDSGVLLSFIAITAPLIFRTFVYLARSESRLDTAIAPHGVRLGCVEDRIAARFLIAARDERIQRERIVVRNGALFFDEDTEHAGFQ